MRRRATSASINAFCRVLRGSGTLRGNCLSFLFLYYVICLLSSISLYNDPCSRDARASTDRRQMRRTPYFCCCAIYARDARASAPMMMSARAVSLLIENRVIYTSVGCDRKRYRDNRKGSVYTILLLFYYKNVLFNHTILSIIH